MRSDNRKEFDNTNIEDYCDEVGTKHEVSATYTLQQNWSLRRNLDSLYFSLNGVHKNSK